MRAGPVLLMLVCGFAAALGVVTPSNKERAVLLIIALAAFIGFASLGGVRHP